MSYIYGQQPFSIGVTKETVISRGICGLVHYVTSVLRSSLLHVLQCDCDSKFPVIIELRASSSVTHPLFHV